MNTPVASKEVVYHEKAMSIVNFCLQFNKKYCYKYVTGWLKVNAINLVIALATYLLEEKKNPEKNRVVLSSFLETGYRNLYFGIRKMVIETCISGLERWL